MISAFPCFSTCTKLPRLLKTRTRAIWDGYRPATVRGLRTKWIPAINSADMIQECHRGLFDHEQAKPSVPETSSQAQLRGSAKLSQNSSAKCEISVFTLGSSGWSPWPAQIVQFIDQRVLQRLHSRLDSACACWASNTNRQHLPREHTEPQIEIELTMTKPWAT